MRIGLMTWFQYYNYGTSLQLFALYRVLEKKKHVPSIVNYKARPRGAVLPKGTLLDYCGEKLKRKISNRGYVHAESSKKNALFEAFLRQLRFTKPCEVMSQLESLNDTFDAFVCGSDQIWSPTCFDPHFFLDYAGDDKLIVSYAPSMGVDEVVDEDIKSAMKPLLERFSALSIREQAGAAIIGQITGRAAEIVLDPTLLLSAEEWAKIAEAAKSVSDKTRPYLLTYMLGHNEKQWSQIEKIAKMRGLEVRVVPVFSKDYSRKGCIEEAIGPLEFLHLVQNAEYVCTDSFHGTIFSILYGIDFCTFERFSNKDPKSQNSRIHSVLEMLDLNERLFVENRKLNAIIGPVEYGRVIPLLEELRDKSLSYLDRALASVPESKLSPQLNISYNRSMCCGCGACAIKCPTKAIAMIRDAQGFYSAAVDPALCVSCALCRPVCPFINDAGSVPVSKGRLFAYKSASTEVLRLSSSGGFAFDLSNKLLKSGTSVIGSVFDKASHRAVHVIAADCSFDVVKQMQGSKYLQSVFSNSLETCMNSIDPLVVFGTPCQIAGARRLLGEARDVLYVDLICHGVPSAYLYEGYCEWLLEKFDMDKAEIVTAFRDKRRGWHRRTVCSDDGVKSIALEQDVDPFFRVFEQGHCYDSVCYECPWRSSSQADLRIGDYWGPRFADDETGVSMVLALTEKGLAVLQDETMLASGDLAETPIADYLSVQQLVNVSRPVFRDRLIAKLGLGESLDDILVEFVRPFEIREKARIVFHSLKKVIVR